jgi:hypothetical protein
LDVGSDVNLFEIKQVKILFSVTNELLQNKINKFLSEYKAAEIYDIKIWYDGNLETWNGVIVYKDTMN